MAERPGIMVYFDMAEPLKVLGHEEKGRLLDAMLDYGQFGVVPEFDGVLTVVWGFIRPNWMPMQRAIGRKLSKIHIPPIVPRKRRTAIMHPWILRTGVLERA